MTETLPLISLEEQETLTGIEWRIVATLGHEGVSLSLTASPELSREEAFALRQDVKNRLKARMTEILRHIGWIQ